MLFNLHMIGIINCIFTIFLKDYIFTQLKVVFDEKEVVDTVC